MFFAVFKIRYGMPLYQKYFYEEVKEIMAM
jgi:hypothetical protein